MKFESRFGCRPHRSGRWRAGFLAIALCPVMLLAQGTNPCDLTGDGNVDVADVGAAVSMAVGQSPCVGTVSGTGTCNVVGVQRVVNAQHSGDCATGPTHYVTLSWIPSASASVAGYYIYRESLSDGVIVMLTASPVTGSSYTDTQVQPGQTYLYAIASVDNAGDESSPAGPILATVPSP